MKKFLLLFSIACNFLYAFYDEELEEVWSSITDINHPTIEDYKRIEDYLKNGKRPYLDNLRNSPLKTVKGNERRLPNITNFKFVGPNGELPVFEVHHLNIHENTKKRCILLFASYNGIYPDKAKKILAELQYCGYSGDVLLRIGGFPDLENGGLKLAHIPYAFKVAFLKEAERLGYKEVLWLDTSMHPFTNLERIFSKIKEKGWFIADVGSLTSNRPANLESAAESLYISLQQFDIIPHIIATMIGIDMENAQAVQFLNYWHYETKRVYPNITWFPEELSLSVAAWRNNCVPVAWFGEYACNEGELLQLQNRKNIQFYIDALR